VAADLPIESPTEGRRTPRMRPAVPPTSSDRMTVKAVSTSVTTSPPRTMASTGWPRCTSDCPRSPRARSARYENSCTSNGSSRRNSVRSALRFSGVARVPRIVRAGSPGMIRTRAKVAMATPAIVTRSCPARARMILARARRSARDIKERLR
jgi:hypothetical protein